MEVIVHGTKGGYKVLYQTPNVPFSIARDVRRIDRNDGNPVGKSAYSIAYAEGGCVFTQYIIVRDTERAAVGNIAFSVYIPKGKKMAGVDVVELLDNLAETYRQKYIIDGNLGNRPEDWTFVSVYLKEYERKLISEDFEKMEPGVGEAAFLYYNQNDLSAYFDWPRQEQYTPFKQVFLVNSDLQKERENPLFALRHDSTKDLTGQIDLDNPEYNLNNFQNTGKYGAKIEIWVNGNPRNANFKFRKKDHIRIKYSKEYYEDVDAQGTISSGEITPYLKANANYLVKLELDVQLLKKVRKIRFEPRDSRYNLVSGAEIRCTNSISKNNVKFAKEDENFEIKFEGEELKDTWAILAKKGNMISRDCSITPKNSDYIIPLTLIPHLTVRFEASDNNSEPVYGFSIQIPDKKLKQGVTEVEFIGDEIDKTWKITISHSQRGYEDQTFDFCPAKEGDFKSVSLYKKHPPVPPPPSKEGQLGGYKVSAGKHGWLKTNDLTSKNDEGSDVIDQVIAQDGYKFKKFTLKADTLVAQYSKTNSLFKSTTFRIGGAFIVFILIVFIVLKSIPAPNTRNGASNGNTEESKILEYINGIELYQARLEEWQNTHCKSSTDTQGKPKQTLWEIFFPSDSRGEANSKPTISPELCPKIQDALNIRSEISRGKLDELQNKVYSDAQKQFENVIKTIDGKFKATISDLMFKYQNDFSNKNLNEIADFIKNYQELLKIREKVKAATNTMELEIIIPDIDKISFPVDSVKDNIKDEIKIRKSNLRAPSSRENPVSKEKPVSDEYQESLLPPGKPVKSVRELQESRWEYEFWKLVKKDGPIEFESFRQLFTNFAWSRQNETKIFYHKYIENKKNFQLFQKVSIIQRIDPQINTIEKLAALIEAERN